MNKGTRSGSRIGDLGWLRTPIDEDMLDAWIDTNWCVITGPPDSGKSTLVSALAAGGFDTRTEVARAFIAEQLHLGRTYGEIVVDPLEFQRSVLEKKYQMESRMAAEAFTFLDRGIPDSIGFYRIAELDPADVFALARTHVYHSVCLLEWVPQRFREGECSRYGAEQIRRLTTEIEAGYRELGYEPTAVPFKPVEDRVTMVLDIVAAARAKHGK